MKRRFLLKGALAATAVSSVGLFTWIKTSSASDKLSITYALDFLESIQIDKLSSGTQWTVSKVFLHCAQSVNYSMLGFPEHKSDAFKSTIGALAFAIFEAKGSMNHSLEEDIPGADSLNSNLPLEKALELLKQAYRDFELYQGQLKEHFAYGELNKRQYEVAHVLHLLNHFEEISYS